MPLAAILLVLGAAACHASWNYIAKGARGSVGFTFAIVAASLVLYLPLTLVAIIIMEPTLGWRALGFMLVSGTLHVAYFHMLTQGYRVGDLSLVYPLSRGSGPMLSVAGAVILLGERPEPLAIAGIVLILGGVLVISVPGRISGEKVLPSIGFSLATGACIAGYTLWDKEAVSHVTPIVYSLGIDAMRLLILAPFALLTASARADVASAWRDQRRGVLGIAALSPAAYILVLIAFTLAPLSYVAPAREVSILFGAALGLGLLREAFPVQRIAGASAVVAGLFALAFG